MKWKFFIIGIVLIQISCEDTQNILEANIHDYVQKNSKILNDYKAVSTEIVDTIYVYNAELILYLEPQAGNNDTLAMDEYCPTLSKFYEKVYCDLRYLYEVIQIDQDKFSRQILSNRDYRKQIHKIYFDNTSFKGTLEEFSNRILDDKQDLDEVYGFSVRHKYRNRIDGDHLLFNKVFYLNKDLEVKAVNESLDYL